MSGYDTINPSELLRPDGPWAHGVRIPAGKELLFVTGQVAVRADGVIPEGAEAQAEMVWGNVVTVLEVAGMGVADIVRMGVYVTSAEFCHSSMPCATRFSAMRHRRRPFSSWRLWPIRNIWWKSTSSLQK